MTRRRLSASCSGHRTTAAIEVVQLGLAMSKLFPIVWEFTSGTTKGTLGSMRKRLDLSMQMIHCFVARGHHSAETSEEAAKNNASKPPIPLSDRICAVLFPYGVSRIFPSEFFEPKSLNSVTGNFLRSRSGISSWPTAPVAHTIPIFIQKK